MLIKILVSGREVAENFDTLIWYATTKFHAIIVRAEKLVG